MDYSNTYMSSSLDMYPCARYKNEDSTDEYFPTATRGIDEFLNEDIDTSSRISDLDFAIAEIKKSIENEKDDEIFYSILLSQAKSEKDKRVIHMIIQDEKKHNEMLKKLYNKLTHSNMMPRSAMSRNNSSSSDYIANLEKAFFSELEAAKKYRRIMFAMKDKDDYNKIMEIMIDEIKHAIKYNFLLAKNRCM